NTAPTAGAMLMRILIFSAKIFLFICMYMLIRWTIPRLRYDQLMRLAWKGLVPMTMALVALQGVILYAGWPQWWTLPGNVVVLLIAGFIGAASGRPVTGRQRSLQSGLTSAAADLRLEA